MMKRNPVKPTNNNNKDYEAILQKNLEEQNEYKIDVLLQNVNELKQIGKDMNDDIHEEKPVLNTVGQNFDLISNLLRQTLTKVDSLMVSHLGKIALYITLIVIVLFIIMTFKGKT